MNTVQISIGGEDVIINEKCMLYGSIKGIPFDFNAHPIDEIGILDGKNVEVLIGAMTMEEWDIRLIPEKKGLDLTSLEKKTFIEL